MGEGLITSNVKNALESIISHCFYANRMLDRMCSLISVTFVMPNTSDIIHHKLAHLYPLLADDISGYMDGRDCTTIYGETIRGDQEYDNYIECFKSMLEINLKLESLIKEAIMVAQQDSDYTTKVFLENFLLKIVPITQTVLLLTDKAEMYGESNINSMRFDDDITDFGIFGE